MRKYTIAVYEEETTIAEGIKEIIENNPLYQCVLFSSLEELVSGQNPITLALINPTLINVTKTANFLKKRGAELILITDEDQSDDLYGIDTIYPTISKPVRSSNITTTVDLTIQNMRTRGELEIYSHFSSLLNTTLGILQDSKNTTLHDTIEKILETLYKEFRYDLISMQIKDDQFDDTHNEIVLHKGIFLKDESDLKCTYNPNIDDKKNCLCNIMRSLPQSELKKIGTPECSIWTNDLEEYLHELAILEPNLSITKRCTKMDFNSIAVIRITADNELIGLIYIADEARNSFNEKIIHFFEDLATGIGDLIWKRQLSENIKEINKELHEAYKAGNFAMWKYYIDKDLFYFSDDFFSLTNKSPKLNKTNLSDFLISIQYDDRETVLNCFNAIINKTSNNESCEFRFRNMDSEKLKYFKLSLSYAANKNSIRGVLEDITEKEVALLTVQDTKDFLNSILDGMDSAIIVIDPLKNYIIDVNKKAEELLGKTAEELCEIKGTRFLSTRYFKKSKSLVTTTNDSQNFEELLLKGKNGVLIPILRNMVTTSWKGRKHYVTILFDITDRKNLERQLNHAQKMESIGSLSAGIAHEINTPMQYIGDNLGFISDSMDAYTSLLEKFNELKEMCKTNEILGDKVKEIEELSEELDVEFLLEEAPLALEQAQDGVARVTKIVKAMKKFSHPGEEDMTLTDLNDIITNTAIVAKNEWKYFCNLEEELQNDLPMVLCNSNDISQVILNMIVNASHAIEDVVKDTGEKGTIRIKTKSFDTHIHIYIKDTGSGINPENYENIFNPFFTTKEVGKGTGQGLSMAYSIITEKHKGNLTFTSTVGKGTEFTIELPLNNEEEQ